MYYQGKTEVRSCALNSNWRHEEKWEKGDALPHYPKVHELRELRIKHQYDLDTVNNQKNAQPKEIDDVV